MSINVIIELGDEMAEHLDTLCDEADDMECPLPDIRELIVKWYEATLDNA